MQGIDQEIARRDDQGFVIAFYNIARRGIDMPTKSIDDGVTHSTPQRPRLFMLYGAVAEKLGIFTAQDQAEALGNLIKATGIEGMHLSGEAAEAQERLLELHSQAVERGQRRMDRVKLNEPINLAAFKHWLNVAA